jgi:hypothetical protein
MTEASLQVLEVLRSPENLQWHVVPLIALAMYIYNGELEKKRHGEVLLGIYFLATSGVVLEIANALVLHFSGRAALWTTPGSSAFVIYAGWNAEILFLAAIGGLTVLKGLPEKDQRLFGIPNRKILPLTWAIGAVCIEVLLNKGGILVWEYTHWRWPNIYFMVIWWAVPYYLLLWLHDNLSVEAKGKLAAASVAVAAGCHLLFAVLLEWV